MLKVNLYSFAFGCFLAVAFLGIEPNFLTKIGCICLGVGLLLEAKEQWDRYND